MTRIKISNEFQNMFSKRLKKAREKAGYTQEEVAERLAIVTRAYQKYEADEQTGKKYRSIPPLEMIAKLCKEDFLNCDISYLAGNGSISDFRQSAKRPADYLGLKYDAVEKIQKYPLEIKRLLDDLILGSQGDGLLKLLEAIRTYAMEAHHSNVRLESPGANLFETQSIEDRLIGANPENVLPDISKKMLKYAVTSTLDEVLTNIYNDYVEAGNDLLRERLAREADLKKKRILRLMDECKWRKLTTDESIFLLGYQTDTRYMTEDEISAEVDKEMNEKYNRLKESENPSGN